MPLGVCHDHAFSDAVLRGQRSAHSWHGPLPRSRTHPASDTLQKDRPAVEAGGGNYRVGVAPMSAARLFSCRRNRLDASAEAKIAVGQFDTRGAANLTEPRQIQLQLGSGVSNLDIP